MTPDIPQPTKVYAPADETEQALLLGLWLKYRRRWVGDHEVWEWELDPAWCDTEVMGL
jgi:hypothetical protein